MYFTGSDIWMIVGTMLGLLGGLLVAAIRGSTEF
jgi:hypothetical protein